MRPLGNYKKRSRIQTASVNDSGSSSNANIDARLARVVLYKGHRITKDMAEYLLLYSLPISGSPFDRRDAAESSTTTPLGRPVNRGGRMNVSWSSVDGVHRPDSGHVTEIVGGGKDANGAASILTVFLGGQKQATQ